MSCLLECLGIGKTYCSGPLDETVLRDVSLSMRSGENYAVVGPSGSGKTTLLSILGTLLTPTTGSVKIQGRPVDFHSQEALLEMRRNVIGFVFQQAKLLPFLTIEENLRVFGKNCGLAGKSLDERIGSVADSLGIGNLLPKRPKQVSGGQRQRAAIARAVLHRPAIILADEPTASLDWNTGQLAVDLLLKQAKKERALLVAVTHDMRLAAMFERVLTIDSGSVVEP